MPNVHRLPAKAFRPQPDEHAQAMALLRERGLTMDALLQACQRALIADPDGALAALAPHWPGKGDEDAAE
ncbi:hypothetical protein [Microbispora sp. CA-102843]|uniref:hypothetical protein n=1 Tax=Microbispora sp. CA-102843 TaxID=3239952 RepID=UPI003D8B42A2